MAIAMRIAPLLPILALLAACGPNPSDPGPGGVTVSEAEALDDAAEMLEQQRNATAPIPTGTPIDSPTEETAQ